MATPKTSGANVGAIASAATSTLILAANPQRNGLLLTNTDANMLYLKYGEGATITTSYTVAIPAGGYWEMPRPVYSGVIHGIWAADGSGSAVYTEI